MVPGALPDATVTLAGDKSLVYGRVLVDDWPPFFEGWLAVRPRGQVVCVAHPWNAEYAKDGSKANPRVFRFDGSDMHKLLGVLKTVRNRVSGEAL